MMDPYTQDEHDRAVADGCLWLLVVALVALTVMVWGCCS